jgi:hypothetical protein
MTARFAAASLSTAVLAAALTVSGPSPATAGDELPSQVVLHDGPGDVRQWVADDQAWVAADLPESDVLRARVRHGRGALKIRMLFADLRRIGHEQTFRAVVKTPRSMYGSAITVAPGSWRGRVSLADFTREAVWRCPGSGHFVDYSDNQVRIRVPRDCLDKPDWLRVTITNDFGPDGEGVHIDNPHKRSVRSGFTQRLHRSSPTH